MFCTGLVVFPFDPLLALPKKIAFQADVSRKAPFRRRLTMVLMESTATRGNPRKRVAVALVVCLLLAVSMVWAQTPAPGKAPAQTVATGDMTKIEHIILDGKLVEVDPEVESWGVERSLTYAAQNLTQELLTQANGNGRALEAVRTHVAANPIAE